MILELFQFFGGFYDVKNFEKFFVVDLFFGDLGGCVFGVFCFCSFCRIVLIWVNNVLRGGFFGYGVN